MQFHTIDLQFREQPHAIAAFLIESAGELALIETGPSSTSQQLRSGIRDLGFDPADVRKVLVTHIHLDHAGGAGGWAAQGAQIFVHRRGARHLADPSRLEKGARMVYGDAMDELWGEILPIPEAQVTALEDGDSITVGDVHFQAWDTPGHARHHHVFVAEGIAFTGDVVGCRLPNETYISPTTAPSQFDPEEYASSLQRLREAKLDRFYLTHFGVVNDVADHLSRYETIIQEVSELVHAQVKTEASADQIGDAFTLLNRTRAEVEGVSESVWERYETANPSAMCAEGVAQYWA